MIYDLRFLICGFGAFVQAGHGGFEAGEAVVDGAAHEVDLLAQGQGAPVDLVADAVEGVVEFGFGDELGSVGLLGKKLLASTATAPTAAAETSQFSIAPDGGAGSWANMLVNPLSLSRFQFSVGLTWAPTLYSGTKGGLTSYQGRKNLQKILPRLRYSRNCAGTRKRLAAMAAVTIRKSWNA